MGGDNTFRTVRVPGRVTEEEPRKEPQSWSARRMAITALVLLLTIGLAWWVAWPQPREPAWWEPEGQQQLGVAPPSAPIDLAATDTAIEALERWPRMKGPQKWEATRAIDKVFDLGGTGYVAYVDVNREMILEQLQLQKQIEIARRAAGASSEETGGKRPATPD